MGLGLQDFPGLGFRAPEGFGDADFPETKGFKVDSLIKGYWSLWVFRLRVMTFWVLGLARLGCSGLGSRLFVYGLRGAQEFDNIITSLTFVNMAGPQ